MTKRFAAALGEDGRASARSKFVVPDLGGAPHFVELKTGRRCDKAYIVYTGRDVTADDALAKLPQPPTDAREARALVATFLSQLQECAIGNVISVESGGRDLRIRIDAIRPKSDPTKPLPK